MAVATKAAGNNSHILTETVITLREASEEVPGRPHFSTVFRWHKKGILVDGERIYLETYKIGQRLITSREACHRFLEATQF